MKTYLRPCCCSCCWPIMKIVQFNLHEIKWTTECIDFGDVDWRLAGRDIKIPTDINFPEINTAQVCLKTRHHVMSFSLLQSVVIVVCCMPLHYDAMELEKGVGGVFVCVAWFPSCCRNCSSIPHLPTFSRPRKPQKIEGKKANTHTHTTAKGLQKYCECIVAYCHV